MGCLVVFEEITDFDAAAPKKMLWSSSGRTKLIMLVLMQSSILFESYRLWNH
uniref:Uncharacterized protein n=1 Tax=Arundo donax TaxID=35708 RepID=A0A0A8YX26_ARUDO